MKFVIRLLYWPALLAMIPALILSFYSQDTKSLIYIIIAAVSSSLILYCKTYDWLIILALKRKFLDKALGINTGCYFIVVMIISIVTFVTSYIQLLFVGKNIEWFVTVLAAFTIMIGMYVINLYDAYRADADKVIEALKKMEEENQSDLI